MRAEEASERLVALGFSAADARTLFDHFDDAEQRGKLGHGYARIEWLGTLPGLVRTRGPRRRSRARVSTSGRAAARSATSRSPPICDDLLAQPPRDARVVAAAATFPTGMLGYWVRLLADGGLVAMLTATSPARFAASGRRRAARRDDAARDRDTRSAPARRS